MKQLLLAAALLLPAPAAFAQVIVVGNGDAQICYQSAKTGNSGTVGAIRTCSEALDDPSLSKRDRAATLVNRGVMLMRGARNVEAEADFLDALEINDRLPEAHINLGVTLFHQARFDAALAAYDRAASLDAVETSDKLAAMTLFNRALVHERLGHTRQAYYDFRAAAARQPEWELPREAMTRFTVTRRPAS